jgi:deoxyribonuclease-4
MNKRFIGAHISVAGGLLNAIERARKLNINTIQIFASPPRNWFPPKITDKEAAQFKQELKKNNISSVFLHSIYLVNLASDKPEMIQKSKQSLIDYLNTSVKIGASGVIIHPGYGSEDTKHLITRVIDNINDVLEKTDPNSNLILETTAGQKNAIGAKFEDIKLIIEKIKYHDRIGVCLDTAHTFESGYDWFNQGAEKIISQFNQKIGLKYLKVIHCNDSKTIAGSHVDRHENIGQGMIGDKVFKELLHLDVLEKIPFILETPGFDNLGPDNKNIEHLKELSK